MRRLACLLLWCSAAHADVAIPGARNADAGECDASGKKVTAIDLNGDGKPDAWKLFVKDTLVCKKVDLNFDGKLDMLVHYAPDGQPRLEEMDFDFDGRIDQWVLYDKGKRACQAMDLDGDGKIDSWRRYADDKPVPEKLPTGACTPLAR
jgi:hypothetical protein